MGCLQPVTVPPSFHERGSSKAREVFTSTQGALTLGGSPKGLDTLKVVAHAAALNEYIQADHTTPSLEGNSYQQLDKNIKSLKTEGFSVKKILGVIAQETVLANAYIDQYNTLSKQNLPIYIPAAGAVIPIAILYLSVPQLPVKYAAWQEAQTPDEMWPAFIDLTGTVASCLAAIATAAAYFAFFEVIDPVMLALSALVYIAALTSILQNEYNSAPTLEELVKTPPQMLKA